MKMLCILVLVALAAAGCDRSTPPQRAANEGKAAQSAAGGSADEGKAVRSAAGR
jgi:hypothetical protein